MPSTSPPPPPATDVLRGGGGRPGGHGLRGGVLLLPVPGAADHRVPLRPAAPEGGGQVQEGHPQAMAQEEEEEIGIGRREEALQKQQHGLVVRHEAAPRGAPGRRFRGHVPEYQRRGVQRQRR